MEILCQFWFDYMGHNIIYHNFYCYISRGTSHIPVCMFLVYFNICCLFFYTVIYCLSSVTVHPSSHKTPNNITGSRIIFEKGEFI